MASEYFDCVTDLGVAVCRKCQYAVWPASAPTHLREKHSTLSRTQRHSIVRDLQEWPIHQSEDTFSLPDVLGEPVPNLPVYRRARLCQLDPSRCAYISPNVDTLRKHWREVHGWAAGSRGQVHGMAQQQEMQERRDRAYRTVSAQRLFRTGRKRAYVQVKCDVDPIPERETTELSSDQSLPLAAAVMRELAARELVVQQGDNWIREQPSTKEPSPWLQLTRWPDYLIGHHLPTVARLASLPSRTTEPICATLCESLDRLVQEAHQSVCQDRVNVFDQARINSFLHRPRAADRPLMVQLQKATWRKYTGIWKALLCFVYRTSLGDTAIKLRHHLTARQILAMERAVECADEYVGLAGGSEQLEDATTTMVPRDSSALDLSCLDLRIALLDHDLRGDLFESALVGGLAALGIDGEKGILREAYHYTPTLSGFIKIAQMLVLQKAVTAAERGEVQHPADLLDEMRAQFLVQGTRSPFNWAGRLRIYGKKVRDTTTCLGYIAWSDDGHAVSYKHVSNLTMPAFRLFVRDQVAKAQGELKGLLLLHSDQTRDELGLDFWMHRVVDNVAENRRGWNFLHDPRNLQGPLPNRENWLLERVLYNAWLQDEFMQADTSAKSPRWKKSAVQSYKEKADAFLERLLLLIHLSAGQPPRGTELLSLRHVNTITGHHRNIFIESGMVSTVTTYHKGYSITGSTKIVHRYLPKEVGELLVYYLWVVQPFRRKLDLLVYGLTRPMSPFLWAKDNSKEPWDSSRLGRVLRREFERQMDVSMTLPLYRHLSIAISRKHLQCGGFKRDYGAEDTKFDTQASHTSQTAGTIYARGLEEGAGHVEARKTEYRRISREWHEFLGFSPSSLPPRRKPLGDITNECDEGCRKRRKVVDSG